METLNIQCIEQQQVLITLTLTDSNGAPVDLTKYAVYAASVGAVDPYCRRAARLEWAAAINNECSAFIITAPGHDIARAPWKYTIYIKNRQLGLEWAVVSGRVEIAPRACGTDGIAPASYTVACEATPSGLVNVTLDATVGSISETLEQVKASAAAAAAAAQNAHADLEDAETAATKASQAALAAAADAKVASEKATAAEAAATAAPEACAPYVQQTQQAAAAALEASRAATTAAAGAQASADAAAPAQGYATRAEQAQTAAVQAAADAATAATTATEQAESATAQAESARLAATTATTAADNAQQAATRAEDAATRAEAATPAAARAEAARDAAVAAAATATTAAADLPQLTQRAEDAASASEAAQTAAETAQSTAETAATTATAQAEAAAASAAQSDTDARACALFVPRAEAAQQAAANSASAAAASETAAAASATAAAESAASVDVFAIAAQIAAGTASMDDGIVLAGVNRSGSYRVCAVKNYGSANAKCDYLIGHGTNVVTVRGSVGKCLFSDTCENLSAENYSMFNSKEAYIHLPNIISAYNACLCRGGLTKVVTFSDATIFDKLENAFSLFGESMSNFATVNWAPGTTFGAVTNARVMFSYCSALKNLPNTATFKSVIDGYAMFIGCSSLTNLPAAMELPSITNGSSMFHGCKQLEVEDIVRVVSTAQDLQALETPKTGSLGLPASCKHSGATVDTQSYLNANHPDFLLTLNARGWTVTFGN